VYCLFGKRGILSHIIKKLLRRRDPEKIQFQQNRRLAIHQNEANSPGTDDYISQSGRVGAVIVDPVVDAALIKEPCLHSLIPILSPQNSLINMSKYEQMLKRIRLDNQIKLIKITMPFEKYNADGLELLEGFRMYGHDRITGTEEGFIGKLATQITKSYVFEEEKKK
jgi:hypothetical protein